MSEWKLVAKTGRGLKFMQNKNGDISIADRSGENPDLTDDGPCIVQEEGWVVQDRDVLVPVVKNGENRIATILDVEAVDVVYELKKHMGVNFKVNNDHERLQVETLTGIINELEQEDQRMLA